MTHLVSDEVPDEDMEEAAELLGLVEQIRHRVGTWDISTLDGLYRVLRDLPEWAHDARELVDGQVSDDAWVATLALQYGRAAGCGHCGGVRVIAVIEGRARRERIRAAERLRSRALFLDMLDRYLTAGTPISESDARAAVGLLDPEDHRRILLLFAEEEPG